MSPRTGDGNGVLVGRPDAPVQLEIFCEPQCPHCAELEAKDGDRIAGALDDGRLAVTYRWLTFLDAKHNNDASAPDDQCAVLGRRPHDLAGGVSGVRARPLPPPQSRRRPMTTSQRWPRKRVPEWVAGRITAGDNAVDTNVVNDANRARLNAENPEKPGTPTVYDMNTEIVVDLQYSDWLDKLLG
ncbi:thioredoxin domain-containing protein [Mycolicibacterium vaccae]|nr:thioredoxin domain-containing protein [Mycolicibacterium vaccae]